MTTTLPGWETIWQLIDSPLVDHADALDVLADQGSDAELYWRLSIGEQTLVDLAMSIRFPSRKLPPLGALRGLDARCRAVVADVVSRELTEWQ